MLMTRDEIVCSYREAKNKLKQTAIMTEKKMNGFLMIERQVLYGL